MNGQPGALGRRAEPLSEIDVHHRHATTAGGNPQTRGADGQCHQGAPWYPQPMRSRIPIDREKLADFCRRHHIRRLAFFGSVLRDDFGPDSDVDVLVEFETGHVPGLAFVRLEQELSGLLGGPRIDLVTPNFLNERIRDRVLSDAEVQYVEG